MKKKKTFICRTFFMINFNHKTKFFGRFGDGHYELKFFFASIVFSFFTDINSVGNQEIHVTRADQ